MSSCLRTVYISVVFVHSVCIAYNFLVEGFSFYVAVLCLKNNSVPKWVLLSKWMQQRTDEFNWMFTLQRLKLQRTRAKKPHILPMRKHQRDTLVLLALLPDLTASFAPIFITPKAPCLNHVRIILNWREWWKRTALKRKALIDVVQGVPCSTPTWHLLPLWVHFDSTESTLFQPRPSSCIIQFSWWGVCTAHTVRQYISGYPLVIQPWTWLPTLTCLQLLGKDFVGCERSCSIDLSSAAFIHWIGLDALQITLACSNASVKPYLG